MDTLISVYPRATEKAYGQAKNNVYVFDVPVTANKQQIIAAIESQFEVTIVNIKTLLQTGKAIRANRGKRSQPGITKRKDSKKAYVTLAEGDSIKVFDEATESDDKATTKEKK
ncbi:MAG TPA: 50S ribosomal protein L23 [Candidatus Saccharimonadales bacterium]|nr:50S ribosomal protein L23 [Candidatus Saccharimonadales bacterium]